MTPFEATLLHNAMQDLGGTFERNRHFDEQKRRTAVDEELQRELMGMRRQELGMRSQEFQDLREDRKDMRDIRREEVQSRDADRSDARENRRLSLEGTQRHQAAMEALQREQNADNRAKMGFQLLSDMNKEGALTDEGLKRMEDVFNEQFGQAGLQVRLFRSPEATKKQPTPWKHPTTGKEFVTFGNTIQSADVPYADVKETVDPISGKPTREITRKVKASDLDRELAAEMNAGGGEERFDSVDAARAKGKKAGDIIMLFDPSRKTYRRFQLE